MPPPETRSQEIERNFISLRYHFEELRKTDREEMNRRFLDAEKNIKDALAAADKAVNKAEIASDKRADASNEIRGAMVDAQANFATKIEIAGLEKRIALLEDSSSRRAGEERQKSKSSDTGFQWISIVIAAMSLIAGIVVSFIIEKVSTRP